MILKFQQGGGALPPLVRYQPVTVTGKAAPEVATSAENSGKSSDLTDKDLLDLLNNGLDGLPSDMKLITQSLQNFYINQKHGPSTSNITSRYLNILNQIKVAKFHRQQYDNAFNIVKQNGGINEVAIDERGRFVCVNDEGDFKLLTSEELKDNKDYNPLTNSELLEYRAFNVDSAFNTNILSIVQNGIGIEQVTKMVQGVISKLGTDSSSEEGYVSSESRKILTGINDFVEAIQTSQDNFNPTINNLYKYKKVTESQARQIQTAFNYIYNTLPENAKALLKYKAQNVEGGLEYLLGQLINTSATFESEFSLTMEDGIGSKKSSGKGSGSSGGGDDMNPVSMLLAGYGEHETFLIQTSGGGRHGIAIDTVRMPITTKEGNSIGTEATLADVSTSAFAGALNFEHASMGGVMIPTTGFDNIAINGTALHTGYLPIDLQEYSRTGNIKPDFGLLEKFKQAQEKIKQDNITDFDKINAVYQEYGLPIMYTNNGDVLTSYKEFGMINATAIDNAFEEDVDFADYLFETLDENTINNTLNILNKGRSDKDRIDFDSKSWYNRKGGDGYDKVFKGVVFIPINQDHFTATAGTGKYPSIAEAEVIEARQQAKSREEKARNSYVNPGRL